MLTDQQKETLKFYRAKKESHAKIAKRLGVDVALVTEFSASLRRRQFEQVQPHRVEDPTPEEIQQRCAEERSKWWKYGKIRIKESAQ